MADQVNERFERFRSRFLADGFADPQQELAGLEGNDRAELSLLIEYFLIEVPRREWDQREFRRSGAAELSERVVAALSAEAAVAAETSAGSERLKDLRDGAMIARAALVEQLADELGLLPEEGERVGFYYHHMERGTLPLAGISDRVFEALADILRVGIERLRRAAELSQREEGSGESVFARSVTGTRPSLEAAEADGLQLSLPDRRSEVDCLFTDG